MTAADRSGPIAAPAAVTLEDLRKSYADVEAVAGVDLTIGRGEFFSMLGPSGSGKTTTLRMIAGFERPTAGRILLDGRDVTGVPPFERDVNTVFQDYALFPHMTVGDNVAYGLMVRKVERRGTRAARGGGARDGAARRASRRRRPAQLSGGQRQRVALARALVNRPRVLLLDEPLGALDLKLRQEMQIELKAIQQQVGITFIYVTHDQEEALTMSDRMAVFNRGRIEQVGTPAEVYERPATPFVAGFVGTSNLLTGAAAASVIGQGGTFTVRPEKIRLAEPDARVADDELSALGERARCRVPRLGHPLPRRPSTTAAISSSRSRTSRPPRWRPWPPRAGAVRLIWHRRARPAARGRLSITDRREATRNARNGGTMHNLRLLAAVAGLMSSWPHARAAPRRTPPRHRSAPARARSTWSSGTATPSAATNDQAYDWVTPFEPETGCKVKTHADDRLGQQVSADAVRAVRRRVGVGRRDDRLIAGGIVAPINTEPDPELRERLRRA